MLADGDTSDDKYHECNAFEKASNGSHANGVRNEICQSRIPSRKLLDSKQEKDDLQQEILNKKKQENKTHVMTIKIKTKERVIVIIPLMITPNVMKCVCLIDCFPRLLVHCTIIDCASWY